MQSSRNTLHQRFVSDYGEILIVRVVAGVKTLTDACDGNTIVIVPSGRRARLVRLAICGPDRPTGRDMLTRIFQTDVGTGFASVGHPSFRVLLRDLSEGQIVDVLPAAHAAATYAKIPKIVPELHGAIAVQPVYAEIAA